MGYYDGKDWTICQKLPIELEPECLYDAVYHITVCIWVCEKEIG